jgi:hypothetical protein
MAQVDIRLLLPASRTDPEQFIALVPVRADRRASGKLYDFPMGRVCLKGLSALCFNAGTTVLARISLRDMVHDAQSAWEMPRAVDMDAFGLALESQVVDRESGGTMGWAEFLRLSSQTPPILSQSFLNTILFTFGSSPVALFCLSPSFQKPIFSSDSICEIATTFAIRSSWNRILSSPSCF